MSTERTGIPRDFADGSCAFNARSMLMIASYETWLEEVERALASINMPMGVAEANQTRQPPPSAL